VLGWTYLFKDQEGGRHYILPRRLDVRFQPGISAKHALEVIEEVGGWIAGLFATVRAFGATRGQIRRAEPRRRGDPEP